MAIYLQQIFGLAKPPVPSAMAAPSVANDSTILNASTSADDLYATFLDGPPAGLQLPVSNSSRIFSPDMTNVTLMVLSPAELGNASLHHTVSELDPMPTLLPPNIHRER